MTYKFESIDEFLFSIETEIINILYDYNLLIKFTPDVKKVIMYVFIYNFNERMHNNVGIFYHTKELSNNHELMNYFEKSKLDAFINKICVKLKKVTHKIIFVKPTIIIPSESRIDDLDGSIVDELVLMDYSKPIDVKSLRHFLDNNRLGHMFESMSKRIY